MDCDTWQKHSGPGFRIDRSWSRPGVYDALTALIAEQAGFDALYVTGAGIAYTKLGRSDIGLVSMSEVIETVGLMRDRVAANLIVDADTGYGNALNVQRTVRLMERAGANGDSARRPGISQALRSSRREDAGAGFRDGRARSRRRSMHATPPDTLIIARTDAVAVEGYERAIARAELYRDAGADMLFVEAPRRREELGRICADLGQGIPLMANMVEGGKTPILSADELQALGFAPGDFSRRHCSALWRSPHRNSTPR